MAVIVVVGITDLSCAIDSDVFASGGDALCGSAVGGGAGVGSDVIGGGAIGCGAIGGNGDIESGGTLFRWWWWW